MTKLTNMFLFLLLLLLPQFYSLTLHSGRHSIHAILPDGSLYVWGLNHVGQLGLDHTDNLFLPKRHPTLSRVTDSCGGPDYACYLSDGVVMCSGQWPVTNPAIFTHIPVPVVGLTDVTQITCNGKIICAIKRDKSAYCFGDDYYGAAGFNVAELADPQVPTCMYGFCPNEMSAAQISTSCCTTCLVTNDGSVYCTGHNAYAQIGDGTTERRLYPVPVIGLSESIIQVKASLMHTCALSILKHVYCWGSFVNSQPGFQLQLTPTPPINIHGEVVKLTGNEGTTCVIYESSRHVSCFGSDSEFIYGFYSYFNGVYGNGEFEFTETPVMYGYNITGVMDMTFSGDSSCIFLQNMSVMCTGDNTYGTLGWGILDESSTTLTMVEYMTPIILYSPTETISGAMGPFDTTTHMCTLSSFRDVLKCDEVFPVLTYMTNTSLPEFNTEIYVVSANGSLILSQWTDLETAEEINTSLSAGGVMNITDVYWVGEVYNCGDWTKTTDCSGGSVRLAMARSMQMSLSPCSQKHKILCACINGETM